MSGIGGGLGIDHGGAISVDPEVLRDVGRRTDAVASRYADARRAVLAAYGAIVGAPGLSASIDTVGLWAVGDRAADLEAECRDAAQRTLLMADVYEYVELSVGAEARALSGDESSVARRMERLEASDARIPGMAKSLIADWQARRYEGLDRQFDFQGLLAPLFFGAALVGSYGGRGVIPRGAVLTGGADPVRVSPVATSTPASAPVGIAGSLRRMPAAPGSQIAVEKYTFADGTARYLAFVKGTQASAPWDAGGEDPWDMASNVQLYDGQTSSSYLATLAALEQAGARPGDEVDIVAHSQGAMIAGYVAMEGEYDVKLVVTAGSPVDPTLDDDQTLVALGYTDDPVRALAGGGQPSGTGSVDSVTITREDDPGFWLTDPLDPHMLDTYVELAEEADKSGDPRIEAIDGVWRELDGAEVIERTEYRARRIG